MKYILYLEITHCGKLKNYTFCHLSFCHVQPNIQLYIVVTYPCVFARTTQTYPLCINKTLYEKEISHVKSNNTLFYHLTYALGHKNVGNLIPTYLFFASLSLFLHRTPLNKNSVNKFKICSKTSA